MPEPFKNMTIAEDYLHGRCGSLYTYHRGLQSGQRLGQAFFNALSRVDQFRLAGRPEDPFHTPDAHVLGQLAVERAICFLLDHEDVDIKSRREEK